MSIIAEPSAVRIQLSTGELYIPSYFKPDSQFNLIIHLHGSFPVVQECLEKSGINAALATVQLNGFSSVYQTMFLDQQRFGELLAEIVNEIKGLYPDINPQIRFLCVSAFSAGYGGVREILKNPDYYDQIDAVYLADCPHTGYVYGNQIPPEQIESFVRFAKDAAQGKKQFLMTHSKLVPGSYASTTECANYLIEQAGAARATDTGTNELGMVKVSKCEKGNFLIYGYEGDTGADHMKHLSGLYLMWKQIQFP